MVTRPGYLLTLNPYSANLVCNFALCNAPLQVKCQLVSTGLPQSKLLLVIQQMGLNMQVWAAGISGMAPNILMSGYVPWLTEFSATPRSRMMTNPMSRALLWTFVHCQAVLLPGS